ncbi:hypothetical protein AB0283_05685 [Micromonospora vinacea]|uniref:hypothetical protein n=1 Tax=Micromonospora vinacea TaxID=709878 RepID=UPI00344D5635
MAAKKPQAEQSQAKRIIESFALGIGVTSDVAHQVAASVPVHSIEPGVLMPLLLKTAERCGAMVQGCIYVSTPITTGRRHSGLTGTRAPVQSSEGESRIRLGAIEANRRHALGVTWRVRAATSATVIEPTSLVDVPGWRQQDYHHLWTSVLERYASSVVFVDGWQFSVGCAIEFATAVRLRLKLMDERMELLDAGLALSMLQSALLHSGAGPDGEDLQGIAIQSAAKSLESRRISTEGQ